MRRNFPHICPAQVKLLSASLHVCISCPVCTADVSMFRGYFLRLYFLPGTTLCMPQCFAYFLPALRMPRIIASVFLASVFLARNGSAHASNSCVCISCLEPHCACLSVFSVRVSHACVHTHHLELDLVRHLVLAVLRRVLVRLHYVLVVPAKQHKVQRFCGQEWPAVWRGGMSLLCVLVIPK